MKRFSWLILLLVFSLVLAACGGDEPEMVAEPAAQEETAVTETQAEPTAEPTEVPTEAPTNTPVPTDTPEPAAEEVAFNELDLATLDEFTSYRYDMIVEIVGTTADGTETTQTMLMNLAVSADPPATSMTMSADGIEEMAGMGTMEFVQIEDTSYMVIPEMGCIALPADEGSSMATEELTNSFSPETLTENLQNVTFVGEESIEGIDVLHYTYDESSLKPDEAAGIETAEGHIYIAKDGGYMVRSIMDITGSSTLVEDIGAEAFQSATTHIEMNLTDVNEAVVIEPPAGCEGEEASVPDWPVLNDAADLTSFAGIVSYSTETPVDEVTAFYNEAMAELGYTYDEASSFISEGASLLNYVNENDETVGITVSQDADSGMISVTILADTMP